MRFLSVLALALGLVGVSVGQVFEPIRKEKGEDGRGRRFSFTLQSTTFDWDLHLPGADAIFDGKESFLASIDYQLSKNTSIGAWLTKDTQEFEIFTGLELDTDWWEVHYTRTLGDSDDNSTVGVQVGLLMAELDLSTMQEDVWATLGVVGSMPLDGGDDPKVFMGMHLGYAFNIEGNEFGGSDEPSLFGGDDALTYGVSFSYAFSDTLSLVAAYWVFDPQSDEDSSLLTNVDRLSFGLGFKF